MDYQKIVDEEIGNECKNCKCIHYELCKCLNEDKSKVPFVRPDDCHFFENEVTLLGKLLTKYKEQMENVK
jgi:hypothetical protein